MHRERNQHVAVVEMFRYGHGERGPDPSWV